MSVNGRFIAANQAELSQFYGVSPKTIGDWRKRGLPGRSGHYDLATITKWLRQTVWTVNRSSADMNRNDQAASTNGDRSTAELQREKLSEEVAMKKLRRLAMEGKLVDRSSAKSEISKLFHIVRARITATPAELASSLPTEFRSDFIADAKTKIELILNQLSEIE